MIMCPTRQCNAEEDNATELWLPLIRIAHRDEQPWFVYNVFQWCAYSHFSFLAAEC